MSNDTATLMQNTFGAPSDVWTGDPKLPTPVAKPQPNQRRLTAKRLTIDISGELHIRIKVACAQQGVTIGEMIRDMLEKRFHAQR